MFILGVVVFLIIFAFCGGAILALIDWLCGEGEK